MPDFTPDWNLIKLKKDYSIINKLEFEHTPVAVNYCFYKPEGVKILDKPAGLCEMAKVCNEKREAFYITAAQEDCVGKRFLGLPMEIPHMRHPDGGRLGVNLGCMQRPINNLNLRQYCPTMVPGSVNYALFTPFEKMVYEPDLLVFVGPPTKADVILRANSYITGEPFESIGTTVANCTNLFVRPVQSGKINYAVTGMSWGMNGRRVYQEGLVIVVVPFQKISTVLEGLNEMTWYRDALDLDRDGYVEWDRILTEKTQEESQKEYWT